VKANREVEEGLWRAPHVSVLDKQTWICPDTLPVIVPGTLCSRTCYSSILHDTPLGGASRFLVISRRPQVAVNRVFMG
jgi:hypothetical protein